MFNSLAPSTLSLEPRRQPLIQPVAFGTAVLVAAASSAVVAQIAGGRLALLFALGLAMGIVLHRGAFGFTAGFRAMIMTRRTAQVRGQLVLLAVSLATILPLVSIGPGFGLQVRGFVMPVGLELVIGAFLFGVGMQIANGCGSGTLYTLGGGSTAMALTLGSFVAGATAAAFTFDLWSGLPTLRGLSLGDQFGLVPVLAGSVGVLGLVALALVRLERGRHGSVEPIGASSRRNLTTGVWPYLWAGVALALLNAATVLVAGRPWGIVQAFGLWGAQGVDALGLGEPVFWSFWEDPTRADSLHRSVLFDATTLMNIGVVVGAFLAATWAGTFRPAWRIAPRRAIAAIAGGLLLGFGGVMATGCNIGAFVSGIASGSLHGWVWILAALPGNLVGIALRPLFGYTRD